MKMREVKEESGWGELTGPRMAAPEAPPAPPPTKEPAPKPPSPRPEKPVTDPFPAPDKYPAPPTPYEPGKDLPTCHRVAGVRKEGLT